MDRITPLGRFADRELEQTYLAEEREAAQLRMRFICLVTSILYALAAIADYGDLGPVFAFRLLLLARLAVFLLGAGCGLLLDLRNRYDQRLECALCGYMCAIMGCECLELALKSNFAATMGIPATLFIVLGYYLFLPPRLRIALIAGGGGSLAYLATLALATPAPPGVLLNTLLYFILANVFGIYFVATLCRSRRREYLSLQRLREQADRDGLTGVYNRRRTLEAGEALFRSAARYDTGLSVLMLDVDRFKRVNDLHGHAVGDAVLVDLAERCSAELREEDVFGRLGGEEFAALLPHAGMRQALAVAERIRSVVEQKPTLCSRTSVTVTVSIGVEMLRPGDENFGALLRRADKELYSAKRRGRNRVSPERGAAGVLLPAVTG